MAARIWDLFCRVIDNHGDVGVCWRLAVDLAGRGELVRLWIDDASALGWMAPGGFPRVEVLRWPEAEAGTPGAPAAWPVALGGVVIEAFGCALPAAFIDAMATRPRPPVWVDLEYLSAEAYVERSHLLPSPQPGRFDGLLAKHFYYPGFTTATGGLIREPGLIAERQAIDRDAFLSGLGALPFAGERVVSLFCYEQPALGALLSQLAEAPTLLLATHGTAAQQALAWLGEAGRSGLLRLHLLPALTQVDYDRLLWCCDLNFVRGEDSFVRAQWAGAPFVWQAYRQAENQHLVKVQAFLRRHLAGADQGVATAVETLWAVWNGAVRPEALAPLPRMADWRRHCIDWRTALLDQSDLCTRLLDFVASVSAGGRPPH